MFRRGAWLCLAVAVTSLAAAGLTPEQRKLNIDSFEYVWQTVRDKHWDPKLNGLDWQALHDEVRPKVEAAGSMQEARQAVAGMLERLHQTHFGITPPEVYDEMAASGSREGSTGIAARVIGGQAVVTAVAPESPAAAMGVKPGWVIVRVDGRALEPGLRAIEERFSQSTLLDLIRARTVEARLSGAAGEKVRVDFLDGNDRPVALEIERGRPRGTLARLGYLPPMYFWVESRRVRPQVAYIRFNIFFEPDSVIAKVQEAVTGCGDCRGFIIDLRGNPGGIGALSMGLSGFFLDKPGQRLGTMILRDSRINFVVYARPQPFRGPLAILVDGASASTSEIFAGGLKDLGRARIFGTRTAAAALPSVFEKLPNGDGFQYAFANYISEGGKPLEGVGVVPDEEAAPTRAALLAGRDPALDAALAWIDKQNR